MTMWGGVVASCYRRMKPRLCLCKRREKMARKAGENGVKAWRMLSHIDRYEHGERSLLVFMSTVMNMENGRCEMTLTLTDFTLHFSCSFTKLLYSKFIPLLNNFTMQEKCY